jgi:hypothetical protein
LLIAFSSAGERQAGSDFPMPTSALPENVAFSATVSQGDSTSHRGTCLEFTAFGKGLRLPGLIPQNSIAVSLVLTRTTHQNKSRKTG